MLFLAYLGPETMLPMTSVVAGVVGFVMMFGRKVIEVSVNFVRGKSAPAAPKTRARGHRPTTSRNMTPPSGNGPDQPKSSV